MSSSLVVIAIFTRTYLTIPQPPKSFMIGKGDDSTSPMVNRVK